MANTNVIVLSSDEQQATLAFDNPGSLIAFAGAFLDMHDKWDIPGQLVLVHRDNRVVRHFFPRITDLIEFVRGYACAVWLVDTNASMPNLDWSEWASDTVLTKAYDSEDDDKERRAIMQDLGHMPEEIEDDYGD